MGETQCCCERKTAASTGKRLLSNSACNIFQWPGWVRSTASSRRAKQGARCRPLFCARSPINWMPHSNSRRVSLNLRDDISLSSHSRTATLMPGTATTAKMGIFLAENSAR
jgi:hypothetical protein